MKYPEYSMTEKQPVENIKEIKMFIQQAFLE